jgi:tRNA U34 5-methylaminomethyl-2-thiouridine-forming methyltransferase MnmC
MQRKLVQTEDGSFTFFIEELDEHYHSIYGAIQEAQVVFINAGLQYFENLPHLNILEIGFGTGLNALMTFQSKPHLQNIQYFAVEKYPVTLEEMTHLNYSNLLNDERLQPIFEKLHTSNWNEKVDITLQFSLNKILGNLEDFKCEIHFFDLIYFDAFAPSAQPQLWSDSIFQKMFNALKSGGILVTYCAKGSVKRALKSVGFVVEALPGPKNKREMTRAIKP